MNEDIKDKTQTIILYERQKQLLATFLEHGAISRAQYEKSLGDLTVKMGIVPEKNKDGKRDNDMDSAGV